MRIVSRLYQWWIGTKPTTKPVAKSQSKVRSEIQDPVKCTYCGGTKFFEGPSGGMSTNILCANDDCRHWFNWTPIINVLDDLNKVQPKKDAGS